LVVSSSTYPFLLKLIVVCGPAITVADAATIIVAAAVVIVVVAVVIIIVAVSVVVIVVIAVAVAVAVAFSVAVAVAVAAAHYLIVEIFFCRCRHPSFVILLEDNATSPPFPRWTLSP
jgi:hypothetical protein